MSEPVKEPAVPVSALRALSKHQLQGRYGGAILIEVHSSGEWIRAEDLAALCEQAEQP